jgi:hypothetical protein
MISFRLAAAMSSSEIQALQRILKRAQSAPEALDSLDADQLRSLIAELDRDLR